MIYFIYDQLCSEQTFKILQPLNIKSVLVFETQIHNLFKKLIIQPDILHE